MKKIVLVVLSVVVIITSFIGCPPPKPESSDGQYGCWAKNVRTEVNDSRMDVIWENSCEGNIAGYNIYISENPGLSNTEPYNNGPYAGDTNPDDGIVVYPADKLENGKKYYVSVAIIYPDETLSKRTEIVETVCGPRGDIELSIRYKSDQDGYSFDQNNFVRADNIANDLYFYSKDGVDFLNSPHKLDGFLKNNKLGKVGFKGNFDELKLNLPKIKSSPIDDKVAIKTGDWVHLVTPDNKNALIKIVGFSGAGEDRKVSLFFAYTSLAGELLF